jgi:putative two-component system response regulator
MTDIQREIESAKILIVDDNVSNVILLEKILKKAKYSNVLSTTDPRKVLDLYKTWDFDLILLDIQMPHMNGFQVLDQINGVINNDYLPVLVLTANTDNETRLRALKEGAKDFINKPFHAEEALGRIHNILEVRMLYNQRRRTAEILEAKVRERTQELVDTQLEIVRRLGRAGEYRDNDTGMHVIRMSKSCQRLALAAGLGEKLSELILHASPMHDVGKIGIPDHVLLKPGKLTADEWAIMKTHATIGADILGEHGSEIMTTAATIAISHHEKWDGSGYPQGTKGEQIPIEGRIAAICDVFDALTSERPYKKAWTVDDAVAYINDNSGKQFDPTLVKLFNQVLPDLLRIRDRYADPPEETSPQTRHGEEVVAMNALP